MIMSTSTRSSSAISAASPRYSIMLSPHIFYNLAAQSSVGLSFEQPVETIDSIMHGTINVLEAMRFLALEAKFYNASSGECFGETSTDRPADESTTFRPRSPYALGKAASFWAVAKYREAYGLFACSGLLFNHESPIRPPRYVTQKIVQSPSGNFIKDCKVFVT
jgi:GDPmannose 4,6-dehydratase